MKTRWFTNKSKGVRIPFGSSVQSVSSVPPSTPAKRKKMQAQSVKLSDYPYRITTVVRRREERIATLEWLFSRMGPHAYTSRKPRFFQEVSNAEITTDETQWHVKVSTTNSRRGKIRHRNNTIGNNRTLARWYFKRENELALFLIATGVEVAK